MRTRRLLPFAAAAVLLVAFAPSATAAGATATRSGNVVTIEGSDGPDVISVDSNVWNGIIDSAGITAGAGCDQINATEVKCGFLDEGTLATVHLNGGDDAFSWTAATGALTVDGGPGNDSIDGGSAADTLTGADGNDTVRGANGNDSIDGGPGNDHLVGGQDDDTITGGPGKDTVNADGENNAGGNWFGNDQVYVRDGERDVVTCGFGTDVVTADKIDVFDSEGSCESIDAAGGASASSSQDTVAPTQPNVSGGQITLNGPTTGKVGKAYSFTVTTPVPCTATIGTALTAAEAKRVLHKKGIVTLDGQKGDLAAGSFPITWKLPGKYSSAFKKSKPVKVVVVFVCDTADGQTATVTKLVTFK